MEISISDLSNSITLPRLSSNNCRYERGRTARNWFDSDDDVGDAKSLHSSEATFVGRYEEGKATEQNDPMGHRSALPVLTTKARAGARGKANWG